MSQETKPVGEAVKVLIQQVMNRFHAETEQLAAVALKDANLNPEHGWKFDIYNAQYVRDITSPPA